MVADFLPGGNRAVPATAGDIEERANASMDSLDSTRSGRTGEEPGVVVGPGASFGELRQGASIDGSRASGTLRVHGGHTGHTAEVAHCAASHSASTATDSRPA